MPALTQNLEVVTSALLPALAWDEVLSTDDPLLKAMPPAYVDADKVQYDQYESPYGTLPLRGLNGSPQVLQMPGFRRYQFDPGYFGGKTELLENEITSSVQPGTLASTLDVSDRLGKLYMDMATMVVSQFRNLVGTVLTAGTVSLADALGNVFVYQIPSFRTYVPPVGWKANPAVATPISNLITQKPQLQKGTSTKFGADSLLLMNSNTLAAFWNTAQVQSTYRDKYGASFIGLDGGADVTGVNAILQGFDLPKIVVYDYGYFPTLAASTARQYSTWTYIIPDGQAIWLGTRKQQQIGQMQLTRHAGLVETAGAKTYPNVSAENEGMVEISKGLYVRTHYQNHQPHKYILECGFNGSPVLWYDDAACGVTTG